MGYYYVPLTEVQQSQESPLPKSTLDVLIKVVSYKRKLNVLLGLRKFRFNGNSLSFCEHVFAPICPIRYETTPGPL